MFFQKIKVSYYFSSYNMFIYDLICLIANLKRKLSIFKSLGFFTGKMTYISSRARQLKKAREIQAKKLEEKKKMIKKEKLMKL